jgi:hypothetical protein
LLQLALLLRCCAAATLLAMHLPGNFKKPRLITSVTKVSAGEPTEEDFAMGRFVDDVAIMETVCDLVAQDVNAVLFMNNEPAPERGWRANTMQAFMHQRLLRFTLTAYARGKGMEEAQELRVWDLIQRRYSYFSSS